ncbi:hypothetical protein [Lysinibacillus xylanilyticus]|uniref:hypothetical protein n=1 Tax=Lysinibacillus xylanilyticus TaxID=582475 RepID=UPI001111CF76|nr:hypothetical protein [Lysinibacillus xylanilyticus]
MGDFWGLAAHLTPPGSFALCESEASAAMFSLCESEATATMFSLCESVVLTKRKSTSRYNDEPSY